MSARVFVCALAMGACVAACSSDDASVPDAPDAAAPDAAPKAPPAPTSAPPDAGAHDAAPPPSPLDVPASLVKALGDKTYVEGNCQSVMHPGWPNAAQKCTYQNGLVVTIANP